MKKLLVSALTIGMASLMLVFGGSSARADHRNGYPGIGHVTSQSWNVCVTAVSGFSAMAMAIVRINETAVVANQTCSSTNVTFLGDYYPDDWFGDTTCIGTLFNYECSHIRSRLNLRTAVSAQQRRKSGTHEMGHAAGLGHRFTNDSCMRQGYSPPISENFDGHDFQAISNTYN